jgi:hypothetical protein
MRWVRSPLRSPAMPNVYLKTGPPSCPSLPLNSGISDVVHSFSQSNAEDALLHITLALRQRTVRRSRSAAATPFLSPHHGRPRRSAGTGKFWLLCPRRCDRGERRGRNGTRHLLNEHVAFAAPDRCRRRTSGSYAPVLPQT